MKSFTLQQFTTTGTDHVIEITRMAIFIKSGKPVIHEATKKILWAILKKFAAKINKSR